MENGRSVEFRVQSTSKARSVKKISNRMDYCAAYQQGRDGQPEGTGGNLGEEEEQGKRWTAVRVL
jgi:hypothetical protein